MAPYSGAMLAMVARSASGIVVKPVAIELTNLTTPCLRSICIDLEHQVGGGHALRAARRPILKPTTSGISIEIGWPSIAASASMPPTPQPRNGRAVDHRGVAVGADQRVGIGDLGAPFWSCRSRRPGQVLRFTWWQMPVPGGTTRKLLNAF